MRKVFRRKNPAFGRSGISSITEFFFSNQKTNDTEQTVKQ